MIKDEKKDHLITLHNQTMSSKIEKQLKRAGMHIESEKKVLDVVCGMELDPAHTKLYVEHRSEVYYFCNTTCKNHFVNNPEKYVS